MALNPPGYIQSASVIGAPVKYKWNNAIAMKFMAMREGYDRVMKAISHTSYKATFATAAALVEWIAWRLDGLTDVSDALLRAEAAWAGAIDSRYSGNLSFGLSPGADFHDREVIRGPLEIALYDLSLCDWRYKPGSIYLAFTVANLAIVVKQVMPRSANFDSWLSDTLRRASALYPNTIDFNLGDVPFDASHEPPVPRAFFDPTFTHSDANVRAALKDFLQSLDYRQNPYLVPPNEMIANGFPGTPYDI